MQTGWHRLGSPMLSLERVLMTQSNAIRANSLAIVSEIEKRYEFKFNSATTILVPHGLRSTEYMQTVNRHMGVEVLFVGRLEPRKGIDVLLSALPNILNESRDIRFRIIGDNTLPMASGLTFEEQFRLEHKGEDWFDRVRFEGKVTQDILENAYRSCDIFVAPSRFESFGLIFLEAMREGKPVIGCSVGGIPEVVSDGINGLLVEPGNIKQLADAILTLSRNAETRHQFGEAGRRLFKEKFTADRMAKESEELYELARSVFIEACE